MFIPKKENNEVGKFPGITEYDPWAKVPGTEPCLDVQGILETLPQAKSTEAVTLPGITDDNPWPEVPGAEPCSSLQAIMSEIRNDAGNRE